MNPISFRKFLKLFRVAYFLSEGSALRGGIFQYHNKPLNNRYETQYWKRENGELEMLALGIMMQSS